MALSTPISFASLSSLLQFNDQANDYTLVLSDAGKKINMTKATANTLTVPTNAAVAFPIGTQILIGQKGAGQVTVTGAAPPTINSSGGATKTAAQHSVACLIKEAADTWTLSGDITT